MCHFWTLPWLLSLDFLSEPLVYFKPVLLNGWPTQSYNTHFMLRLLYLHQFLSLLLKSHFHLSFVCWRSCIVIFWKLMNSKLSLCPNFFLLYHFWNTIVILNPKNYKLGSWGILPFGSLFQILTTFFCLEITEFISKIKIFYKNIDRWALISSYSLWIFLDLGQTSLVIIINQISKDWH